MFKPILRLVESGSPAARGILAALLISFYTVIFIANFTVSLTSPAYAQAIHAPFIRALLAQSIFDLIAYALIAIWLWPRRHTRESSHGAHFLIGVLIYANETSQAIGFGLYTSAMNMAFIGLLGIGLLLLATRPVLIAFGLAYASMQFYQFFYMRGMAPYAPALGPAVFEHGQPTGWWIYMRNFMFYGWLSAWMLVMFWLLARIDAQTRRLKRASRTDGLTGLSNRAHFIARLEAEVARHERHGTPFCVVLCDADHFKLINDTFGHHAGDQVLRHIAALMQDCTRSPADVSARYGGEEFALLLPDTTAPGAYQLCERLRERLAGHEFQFEGRRVRVSLSVGVVQAAPMVGATALLRQADAALYRAKHEGRNRTVVNDGPAQDRPIGMPA